MSHLPPRQVRAITIAKLAEDGVYVSATSSMDLLCAAVEKVTGIPRAYRQDKSSYLTVYAKPPRTQPRQPAPFRPMAVRVHPRLAEIEAGQPPMLTPGGVGNLHNFGGRLGAL